MDLRYLDSDLFSRYYQATEQWNAMVERAKKVSDTPFVVVVGQYNNGKSTLCNALVKDWKKKTFKIGVVRVTEEIQEVSVPDLGITLVDTPGFDSNDPKDSERARDAWFHANLLVFVHSVRGGELDAKEIAALREIKKVVPAVQKRLFVVCSKFGDEESDRADEVEKFVQVQVRDIVAPDIPVKRIDSIYYLESLESDDPALADESQMSFLLTWIAEKKNMASPFGELFEAERKKYQSILSEVKKNIDNYSSKVDENSLLYRTNLANCWERNKSSIEDSWNRCSQYKK